MTTKNTTDVIRDFLSRKDPLTELNKISNVLDVLRDDVAVAQDGHLDICLHDTYSLLDTCSHNLDEVIEFMTTMQAFDPDAFDEALLEVIRYYSTEPEFEQFLQEIEDEGQ